MNNYVETMGSIKAIKIPARLAKLRYQLYISHTLNIMLVLYQLRNTIYIIRKALTCESFNERIGESYHKLEKSSYNYKALMRAIHHSSSMRTRENSFTDLHSNYQ